MPPVIIPSEKTRYPSAHFCERLPDALFRIWVSGCANRKPHPIGQVGDGHTYRCLEVGGNIDDSHHNVVLSQVVHKRINARRFERRRCNLWTARSTIPPHRKSIPLDQFE